MRLDCPNLMAPIRSEASYEGAITGYLQSGAVVEVKVKESKGFYELADGSVSNIIYEICNEIELFLFYIINMLLFTLLFVYRVLLTNILGLNGYWLQSRNLLTKLSLQTQIW